ncbi:hypothetical protein OROMI_001146 [Orobanche minor]
MSLEFSKLGEHIEKSRITLELQQSKLRDDPLNTLLFEEALKAHKEFTNWVNIDECILKQKEKVPWLKCGDGNNHFFHASLKSKGKKGIVVLYDDAGNKLVDEAAIYSEILDFYKQMLGTSANTTIVVDISAVMHGAVLTHQQRCKIVLPVTELEIFTALNSIGDDKSSWCGWLFI